MTDDCSASPAAGHHLPLDTNSSQTMEASSGHRSHYGGTTSDGSRDGAEFQGTEDHYEDYEEMSVLEYARLNELITDYLMEPLFADKITSASDQELEAELQDPIGVSLAEMTSDLVMKERLTLSKDAAILLKLTCSKPELLEYQESVRDGRKRAAQLKYELPLLQTDNESDLRKFGSISVPNFRSLNLPFEPTDESNDEGLTWPQRLLSLPLSKQLEVEKHKLEISKDDFMFLQTALKDTYTAEDYESAKAEASRYKRNLVLEPMTPPLLPIMPLVDPFALDSPTGYMEPLSDLTNSTAAEGRALDDYLVKNDSIATPEASHIGQVYSPLREISRTPLSSPRKRKAADLRIEGPLTPPLILEPASKKFKSVTFSEVFAMVDAELPSTSDSGNDLIGSQNSFDAFFDLEITPRAAAANAQLEHEQLNEVDTTRRMIVPQLDFSLPPPPWLEFQCRALDSHTSNETDLASQMKLLKLIQRDDLQDLIPWHGVRRIERELQWSPFPIRLGTVALDEEIADETYLVQLLQDISGGDCVKAEDLTWKPDGLRILNCTEDSDDELEAGNFRAGKDLDISVRKRKLAIAEDDEATFDRTGDSMHTMDKIANIDHVGPKGTHQIDSTLSKQIHESENGLTIGGMFSTSTALQKYMQIRGKASQNSKITDSEPQDTPLPMRSGNATRSATDTTMQSTVVPKSTRNGSALPQIPEKLPPCSFIIAATLITQRHLIRTVEKLYPKVDFIERDFESPLSPAKEADVILSASTGLILTTLQKMKQRALPGQLHHSLTRVRVSALSDRYERLVVYVSEGLSADREREGLENPLDDHDSMALTDFREFCSSLEAEVLIKYISGGEQTLARWVVLAMQRWGISTIPDRPKEMKLLQDETLWELFLRHCGMNAYAAQAILATLKSPSHAALASMYESHQSEIEVFGLAAFILLSAEERVERFQVLLGGNRILNRVSTLLDQRWPSAVNGWLFDDSSVMGR